MATKKERSPTKFVRERTSENNGAEQQTKDNAPEAVLLKPYERSPFVVVFPAVTRSGKPFVLDLQVLMPLLNVGRMFFDGHLAHLGPRPKANTADGYTKLLRSGIVAFLVEKGLQEISIGTFCSSTLPNFEAWLNQTKDSVSLWSESTRAARYLYVKTILERAITIPKWRSLIAQRPRFKSNPWPHRAHNVKKKEVIDDDLATRVRVASITEIIDIVRRRGEIQRIIEEDEIESNPKKNDGYHNLRRDHEYERIVVNIHKELLENPLIKATDFPTTFPYILGKYGTTVNEIRKFLSPQPEQLVPFVLLMALGLSYNASTVFNARLSDFKIVREISSYIIFIDEEEISDKKVVTPADLHVNSFKPRAHKRQPVYIPIDNEPDNPYFIYGYISEWTEALRKFSYIGVKDKLFIFCTPRSIHGVSTFMGLDGTANPEGWRFALANFRKKYQLEHFTLDMLRPTSLDVTFEEFGGDIRLAGIQGNHAHIDTTSRSYQSDAEKKRQYERLGSVHNRRERWRKTEGKIDPRDQPEEFDVDCATPGWACADPYDSPYTPKGKLCTGYGRCPACPLGGVNLNSPLSCAYTLGLLDAIDNAQQSLDSKTWLQRWLPVKQSLIEKWIPSFSHRATREARKIDIFPMPRPE